MKIFLLKAYAVDPATDFPVDALRYPFKSYVVGDGVVKMLYICIPNEVLPSVRQFLPLPMKPVAHWQQNPGL